MLPGRDIADTLLRCSRLICHTRRYEKKVRCVYVIEYNNPLPDRVCQPILKESPYIRLGLPQTRQLDMLCDIAKTLFEAIRITCEDPQHPYVWTLLAYALYISDRELGFPIRPRLSDVYRYLAAGTHPPPPRPTRAIHPPGCEACVCRSSVSS